MTVDERTHSFIGGASVPRRGVCVKVKFHDLPKPLFELTWSWAGHEDMTLPQGLTIRALHTPQLYIPSTTFTSSAHHFTLNSTKTLFYTLIVRLPNRTLLFCVWQKTTYPRKNKENWTNTLWSTAYGGVLRYLGKFHPSLKLLSCA